jgi:hypothetical protein
MKAFFISFWRKFIFLDSRREKTSDKSQDARGKEFLDLKKLRHRARAADRRFGYRTQEV